MEDVGLIILVQDNQKGSFIQDSDEGVEVTLV